MTDPQITAELASGMEVGVCRLQRRHGAGSRRLGTRREAAVKNRLQSDRARANSQRSQSASCLNETFQSGASQTESPIKFLAELDRAFLLAKRHAGRDIFRLRRPRMAGAWQEARKDRLNLTGFVSAGKTTGFLSRGPRFYFSSFFFCWRCPRLVFGGAFPLSLFSFSF